jgi:ParB-like chromosome segregation protein Spo0J
MANPKTTKVKVEEVKLNPNNPRVIKDDKFKKLVNSIKNFPEMLQLRPIVVDENMIILGGNMRYRACIEAGLKEVHIIKADGLTEDQKKEFVIKDNNSFGEWDWDALANEWDTTLLDDWGMNIPKIEEFAGLEPTGVHAKSLTEKLDTFINASIKQVVLFYELDEYEEVLKKLSVVCEQNKFEDNSVAVMYLLNNYLQSNESSNTNLS